MRPTHTSLLAAAAFMGATLSTAAAVPVPVPVPVPATVDNAVALAARELDRILGAAAQGRRYESAHGGGSEAGQAPAAQVFRTQDGHGDDGGAGGDRGEGAFHAYSSLDIS
jgi:hypothetical protein